MKTKNVVLGSLALVFAVGTTIASNLLIPTSAFLKVRIAGQSSVTCQDTNIDCESTGAQNCTISIPYQQNGVGPVTTVNLVAYSDAACTVPLKNPSSAATPENFTQAGNVIQYIP